MIVKCVNNDKYPYIALQFEKAVLEDEQEYKLSIMNKKEGEHKNQDTFKNKQEWSVLASAAHVLWW